MKFSKDEVLGVRFVPNIIFPAETKQVFEVSAKIVRSAFSSIQFRNSYENVSAMVILKGKYIIYEIIIQFNVLTKFRNLI